ncbi:MAG TPA: hypothetical protein VIL17_07425 [Coriobacteriia bacterium]
MEFQGELLVGLKSTSDHAVHKFLFLAGSTINLTLVGGTQRGINVFSEGSASVIGGVPLFTTGTGSAPRALVFVAPYSGLYYVDSYTSPVGTSDNYALNLSQRVPSDLIIDPVGNITFGTTVNITGRVTGALVGEPLTGDVVLSYSPNGVDYSPLASRALVGGAFAFSDLHPYQKWYYKVQYLGSSAYNPSGDKATIGTTALLSGVTAKRYATRSYALSGSLRPGLGDGSAAATVRVYLWRYVGGHWKAAGYRTAKASGPSPAAAYSIKYKFPKKGTWRMRAYHSDADHLPTWGAYTKLTVK